MRRDARSALWWQAAGLLVAFAVCYAVLVCSPGGQRVDAAALGQLPGVDGVLHPVLVAAQLIVPGVLGALVVVLAAVALSRGRWRDVTRIVAFVAIASLLDVLAKPALPRPYFGRSGYAWNTFPSGHMAVTVSLLCAVLWLARRPAVWRPVLWALGTAYGWALVIGYAHRQADVVGATLLVAAIASAVLALGTDAGPVRAVVWRRLGLAVGCATVLTVVSVFVPGIPWPHLVGATGTGLLIAATCGAALQPVPSTRRGRRTAIERFVLVGDAR